MYQPFCRSQLGGSLGEFLPTARKLEIFRVKNEKSPPRKRKKKSKIPEPSIGESKKFINKNSKRKMPTNKQKLCQNFALRNSKYAKK